MDSLDHFAVGGTLKVVNFTIVLIVVLNIVKLSYPYNYWNTYFD